MGKLIAAWYIYLYESLYTTTGTLASLTAYSNAVMGTLEAGGDLYTASTVLRTVAFGLLAVYFVITFGTRMEGREITPSVVFRTLLQYFIGFALALNAFDIVKYMFKAGDWLAGKISETTSDTESLSDYVDTFAQTVADIGITDQFVYILKSLAPYLLCLGCSMAIIYIIISRVLRICVNACLAPIAVADFFGGTRRSDAIRFLKRTMAMGLQCAVIMVIVASTAKLSEYISSGSVYSEDMQSSGTVAAAKAELLDNAKNDLSSLSKDVQAAVDKFGYPEYKDDGTLTDEFKAVQDARDALTSEVTEVMEDDELEYQGYEETLGIQVFERDSHGHYVYDDSGYAKLAPDYRVFTLSYLEAFMTAMLGGDNYWIFIMLLVVRMGMVKKSMELANTVVGL